MTAISRRRFLLNSGRGVAGAAAGAMTLTALNHRLAAGANERMRFALIGCGGRGRFVARTLITETQSELAVLCDLNPERLNATVKFLSEVQERKPALEKNMRRVLDDKSIDAVVIATPDHWHAPATILACQAGKDVYVEKPHSHNIWESRKMVEAARKYNRIVEVGTQCRTAPYVLSAREFIRSGQLGRIALVKVFNLKSGDAFKLGDPGKQPEGFDWNEWLGPAPVRPWHKGIFSSGWGHFWDFGCGDMVGDGIHQFDLAITLMGDPGAPKTVSSAGGKLAFPDADGDTPDAQVLACEFENFLLTFEHTNYPRYMEKTSAQLFRKDTLPYWTMNATRIEIYGSELMMTVGRHGAGWIVQTSGGKEVKREYGQQVDAPHAHDFVECLKTRGKPTADIELAHGSLSMLHLGNIAYRVGNQKVRYDGKAERILDNPEADNLIKRAYREGYAVPEKV